MQITYEKVIQILKSKGIKYHSIYRNKIELHDSVKKYNKGDKILRIYENAEHPEFARIYTVDRYNDRGFIESNETPDNVNDPCRVIPYEWIRPSIKSTKSYQPEWL